MYNWFAGLTGFVLENEMLTVHWAGFFVLNSVTLMACKVNVCELRVMKNLRRM